MNRYRFPRTLVVLPAHDLTTCKLNRKKRTTYKVTLDPKQSFLSLPISPWKIEGKKDPAEERFRRKQKCKCEVNSSRVKRTFFRKFTKSNSLIRSINFFEHASHHVITPCFDEILLFKKNPLVIYTNSKHTTKHFSNFVSHSQLRICQRLDNPHRCYFYPF